jgi:chromosome segregation ATPase
MNDLGKVVNDTLQLLKAHTVERNNITSHFTTIREKNETYIAELLVTVDGNNRIIQEYMTYVATLKNNQNLKFHSESNHSSTQNDLQTEFDDCEKKIRATKEKITAIVKEKKNAESENNTIVNNLQDQRQKMTKREEGSRAFEKKVNDGISQIGLVLNSISDDFKTESTKAAEITALLTRHISKEHMPQTIPEYRPEGQFRVKPGEFMVGGRETRDSNNGFHELSARIANLTRQINRVTAV